MTLLANYLGNRLGQTVVDETGLKGWYDFRLRWAANSDAEEVALGAAIV